MTTDPEAIARRLLGVVLRHVRTQAGLSLRELGKRCHHDYSRLSRMETGEHLGDPALLAEIDRILDAGGLLTTLRTTTELPSDPPDPVVTTPTVDRGPAGHDAAIEPSLDRHSADRVVRVLVDGTPLLGQRSGVGRYTAALLAELATRSDVDVTVTAFTARGQGELRRVVPEGVRVRGGPVPARALRACWRRHHWPPVELLAGGAEVLHATNFVLPPSRRAHGVLTVHDLTFLDRPDDLAAAQRDLPDLLRSSVARAAVVCTPSHAMAEQVARLLPVHPGQVVVTPLGVDREWHDATPPTPTLRAALRLPQRYLLFVGAAQPRKGLDVLFAAHQADQDLPPLVLAGPAGWGVVPVPPERVHPVGYLADADLRSVVAGATALVLPSHDEGFGLPVLEAMAAGVPVVCSDVPALREVACGLATLVPPADPTALAAALGAVCGAGPDQAGAAARRRHAAGYTWQGCAEATVRAYRRAEAVRGRLGHGRAG